MLLNEKFASGKNANLIQIVIAIFLSFIVALWCGFRSKFYLGGITGDILGATAFLTELCFLLAVLLMT